MLQELLKNYQVILGSKSPRRQELLKGLAINFKIETHDIEETYPEHLEKSEITEYLAQLKSTAYTLAKNDLLITSDTLVCIGNEVLGKPKDKMHAQHMLKKLSGKTHEVISSVCLTTKTKTNTFSDTTYITFKNLSEEEIDFYIDNYQPFDKAGSYGIQEWIGYIGVTKIEGSYFSVVGLPVQKLYENIQKLLA